MPRGEEPISEDELNNSLYSESEFEYHLENGSSGREEEEEEEEDPMEGTSKLRSTVTVSNISITPPIDGVASRIESKYKGKGGKRGQVKGESRDRSRSPLSGEKRVSFVVDDAERDRKIAEDVTRNLRAEMQAMMQQLKPQDIPTVEELDRLKLEQRTNALMAKSSLLSSEGSKAQYQAFAKIKASSEEARRKIALGDGLAAVEALDRLDKVVNLRLELIQRADKSPGGWHVATVFEQLAQESDANQPKLDRCWKAAQVQVEERKETSRRSATRGRADRGGGGSRGNYSFRSV